MRSTSSALILPLVLAACGGSVSEAADDAGANSDGVSVEDTVMLDTGHADVVEARDTAVAIDTGIDTGAKVDTGPHAPCPDAPPTDGSACGAVALDCDWGTDPRPDCRVRAQCVGAAWRVTSKECAAPKDAATCPAETDAMKMSTCAEAETFCHYPTHLCECAGFDPKYLHWYCDPPTTSAGCPIALPNLGAPCTLEGTSCLYGSCGVDTSAERRCTGGVWADEFPPCGV